MPRPASFSARDGKRYGVTQVSRIMDDIAKNLTCGEEAVY